VGVREKSLFGELGDFFEKNGDELLLGHLGLLPGLDHPHLDHAALHLALAQQHGERNLVLLAVLQLRQQLGVGSIRLLRLRKVITHN
jgi:hypothetical protein